MGSWPLKSCKLHLREAYARVVPVLDLTGAPFDAPGVTVQGEAFAALRPAAEPLLGALAAFEPGIVVRALSLDLVQRRLLATLDPTVPEADPRGRVVRLDGAAFELVARAAGPLVEALAAAARVVLARRALPS